MAGEVGSVRGAEGLYGQPKAVTEGPLERVGGSSGEGTLTHFMMETLLEQTL